MDRATLDCAMSRKKPPSGKRLTDVQLDNHLRSIFTTIEALCRTYDEGHAYIAYLIASELYKLLTLESAVRLRSNLRFSTIAFEYSERNVLPEYKLVIGSVHANSDHDPPVTMEFIPAFKDAGLPTKLLPFKDWWNRDVIFRAGAAQPGINPTLIPVDVSNQVPRSKRFALVRRVFIEEMRNRLGAHLDTLVPEEIAQLQQSDSFGITVVLNFNGQQLTTADGSVPVKIGPDVTTIRQIAYEAIVVYRTVIS